MQQRDYILRIIEQLGAALAELRRRIVGGAAESGARADLDRVAGQAGFDIHVLRELDLGTLRMLVTPGGDVDPARCWLMAEVLYLDGLEATIREEDGFDSLWKARALYELVKPAGGLLVGLPEALPRIEEIDELLAGGTPWTTDGRKTRGRGRRIRAQPRPMRSPVTTG